MLSTALGFKRITRLPGFLGENLGNSSGIPPIPPPAPSPGPLDFASSEMGITVFETPFDVAESDIVLGLSFTYTGNPVFTITHEGEPLTATVALNSVKNVGSLVAIGTGLTVETGNLRIEVSGGTIGLPFGRVNEIGFTPEVVSTRTVSENLYSTTVNHGGTGRIYAVATSDWLYYEPRFSGIARKTWRTDVGGDEVSCTPPTESLGWENDGGSWSHTVAQATTTNVFEVDGSPVPVNGFFKASGIDFDNADQTRNTRIIWHGPNPNPPYSFGTATGNVFVAKSTQNAPTSGFQIQTQGIQNWGEISFHGPNAANLSGGIASGDNVSSFFYSNEANKETAIASICIKVAGT